MNANWWCLDLAVALAQRWQPLVCHSSDLRKRNQLILPHSPFWFNPYLFCTVSLWEAGADRPKEQDDPAMPTLVGASASSLHRLKDLTNTEGAFFVFGDLAATVVGKARLHFCLYELDPHQGSAMMVQSITSNPFDVQVPRDWEGVKESTILSRTFSDQGVKLRLRKESRAAQ